MPNRHGLKPEFIDHCGRVLLDYDIGFDLTILQNIVKIRVLWPV